MAKTKASKDISVKEKLDILYNLQNVVSEIDRIRILRGELPVEVQELEDEIEGLRTRKYKCDDEIHEVNRYKTERINFIKEAEAAIARYTEQLETVRNNREYDSLTKEIEYQNLEIQFLEKKIGEDENAIARLDKTRIELEDLIDDRLKDLEEKQSQLDEIINETRVEEARLKEKAQTLLQSLDERLATAFKRIRKAARNGLAVATVEREACSGCFNKIPPQQQLEIKTHKKIIVCEYCGRILADKEETEE